jgi:hypothetical protein
MNHFERLAEQQMVAAAKAKHRAAEKREATRKVKIAQSEKDAPMKLGELEQKQADQSTQFRAYKRAKREEARVVFERRPADWAGLSRVLRNLTIDTPETLLDYIANAAWLHEADLQTRQVVLSLVDNELVRVRLENGYPPIDDSLPGEAPTAFEIIREQLKVLT